MSKTSQKGPIQRIGMRELRGKMAAILRQAQSGNSFLVMSRDEIMAEIHPPSKTIRSPRRPGALRGRIRMASDFDVLPRAVLSAMESEER